MMVKRANKRLRSADMKAEMIQIAEKIVSDEGLSALTARRVAIDFIPILQGDCM